VRKWLWNWTVNKLIERAKRTPYFHLHHGDGSLYMERYWLVPRIAKLDERDMNCYPMSWWREPFGWLCQRFGIAMLIHVIHTPDLDRALHDHPWSFVSVVLRGWYTELRPIDNGRPCFHEAPEEFSWVTHRHERSIAFRHATDRHRIVNQSAECVTLFVTGPKRQWWGFYTPQGKIHYQDYDSVHNKVNIGKNELQGDMFRERDEASDRA
jgi:hypothetical protein